MIAAPTPLATQPTSAPAIQVVLVPSSNRQSPPTTESSSPVWISVALSVAALLIAAASLWNALRLRGIAERQHATAEGQRKIAEAQHAIAEAQRRTAADKLRLDLFAQRLKVYGSVMDALKFSALPHRPVTHEVFMELGSDARVAQFLFDGELSNMIGRLMDVCGQRRRLIVPLQETKREDWPDDVRKKNDELQARIEELRRYFWNAFPPYLDFTNVGKKTAVDQ